MRLLEATLPHPADRPLVLNVAGPRESKAPGIFETARRVLAAAFSPRPGDSYASDGEPAYGNLEVRDDGAEYRFQAAETTDSYDSGAAAPDADGTAASGNDDGTTG